jgi:threonine dehydratase
MINPRQASTLFNQLVHPMEIEPFLSMPNVWLGDDTVQANGSFKIRGALQAQVQAIDRDPLALDNGVFCPSAGNAAQGAALAASQLGAKSYIFMPQSAPRGKIEAVESFGGVVTLVPGTVDNAVHAAQEACASKAGYFLHPFDDMDVIDGQASLGYEIAASDHQFDAVFLPVGGGGLLAGVCKALASQNSQTKVYGVQLQGCDAFAQSIDTGHSVTLDQINSLADGTAVKTAGTLTLRLVLNSPNFGGMLRVTPRELGCALSELDIFTSITAETAAGLSLAGLKKYRHHTKDTDGHHLALITGKHRDNARYKQLLAA